MEVLKVRITGIAPLLMHSARYANPLDPATKAHKALTSKRKKTDEDHEAIQKSEWLGGLYHNKEMGPYIPGANVEASLFEAAKMQKLGKSAKRSLLVIENEIKLEYKGPRDIEGLYSNVDFVDVRAVKVQTAKLMRCRPKFNNWSITFQIQYNTEQLDEREILRIVEYASPDGLFLDNTATF